MHSSAGIRGILFDIEGTIIPISFVQEVLFPYARAHVKDFLTAHFDSPEIESDLARLRAEHAADVQNDAAPPLVEAQRDTAIDSFADYVCWLIDRDRKSTGLKSLQGKIWEQGYLDGSLKAPLFADVLPALETARNAGLKIAIFSSGSVFAQKLLFAHTDAGDIREFIDDYFDTSTGPKTASESYRQIAVALNVAPTEMLFVSDVVVELDAAQTAGLQTLLCIRPGNEPQPPSGHHIVHTFDQLAEITLQQEK
jgi:enolase-phosphatase E1